MKKITSLLLSAALLGAFAPARADIVELKNGDVMNGTYRGGTATSISFEAFGNVLELPTSNIVSVTFTTPVAVPASTAAAAPAPAPAPAAAPAAVPAPAKSVTLPAGTLLLVRMMDGVSSQNAAGTKFTTKLEYDLIVDGVLAAKGGTVIYGNVESSTQAKRARGKSTLDIRLTQMVLPGVSPVAITTSSHRQAGENSVKKVAKAAAVGAVIGNNTGSGDSGDGAAWGAAAGAVKPGQTMTVAPGTLIEFQLEKPVSVPAIP